MQVENFLDTVAGRVTNPNFAPELQKAKIEYFEKTGTPFEELTSFESRMNSYLEWFILDRESGSIKKKPIDFLIEDCDLEFVQSEKENLKALEKNIHSIFLAKKVKGDVVKVQDLFTKDKYEAHQDLNHVATASDEIFEGRIFLFEDKYYFTKTYCGHPVEVFKFIKNAIKASIKSEEEPLSLIHKLSKMSLMWEKSRNIDIEKIYTL